MRPRFNNVVNCSTVLYVSAGDGFRSGEHSLRLIFSGLSRGSSSGVILESGVSTLRDDVLRRSYEPRGS